ncbi:NCA2-domain-containing protein [Gloeopeniophorella convolvens]|nr:NCA2-domain-containing protein [Gloeopeniophorella convolvens]
MSVSHITNKLILSSSPSQLNISEEYGSTTYSPDSSNDVLHSLFQSLAPPLSAEHISDAIQTLQKLEDKNVASGALSSRGARSGEQDLRDAVLGRLVAGVYAEALDTLLAEAAFAETEGEWWADVERSRLSVVHYLVQTLPLRVSNLLRDVLHTLQSNKQSVSLSTFKLSSIRSILGEDSDHPGSIITSIFPHLRSHPRLQPPPIAPFGIHTISLHPTSTSPSNIVISVSRTLSHVFQYLAHYVTLPVQLTSLEIHMKRKELERIRDERAEALGELTSRRDELSRTLQKDLDERSAFLEVINQTLVGQSASSAQIATPTSLLDALATTSSRILPLHTSLHRKQLHSHSLLRPRRLVRIWPRLLVIPPLALYATQQLYRSQDTLLTLANDAWETLKGFWRGWLVEPLTDIAKTVRTGGEGSVIVQKESISADMQSLERMALSLAKDKLNYSPIQLDDLSSKLRLGDLTPILQIYEEDIKNPVRSAVSGTLLRSAFIQIQKAKVDIDQALAGIDKLLKSQELTFAFVGVAPAFSIVYVTGGYLRRLYIGSSGHGRFGGRRRRTAAWLAVRRVERLLITQPHTHGHGHHASDKRADGAKSTIPPLTAGLLLLSVSSLRQYAEAWLPPRSRLREGFLEDIGDLEDPALDREEKLRVVQRMWRSWGHVLGWERLAYSPS